MYFVLKLQELNADFSNALTNLCELFIARNYPEVVINSALYKVCILFQSEALVSSSKDNTHCSSNITRQNI